MGYTPTNFGGLRTGCWTCGKKNIFFLRKKMVFFAKSKTAFTISGVGGAFVHVFKPNNPPIYSGKEIFREGKSGKNWEKWEKLEKMGKNRKK